MYGSRGNGLSGIWTTMYFAQKNGEQAGRAFPCLAPLLPPVTEGAFSLRRQNQRQTRECLPARRDLRKSIAIIPIFIVTSFIAG